MASRFPHHAQYLGKASQPGFQVLNNLLGQLIWVGEIVEVGEGVVMEPEDIMLSLPPAIPSS